MFVVLGAACGTSPCPEGLALDDDGRCVTPGVDAGPVDAALFDGAVLLPDGCLLGTYYADTDGDGHGDPASMMSACSMPDGFVAAADDCDDDCEDCWDLAPETCDTLDNDCDGMTDEGAATTFYADGDSDGHGDATMTMRACTMPTGYVTTSDDCDDTSMMSAPGGTETCDGLDNDCAHGADDTFACVLGTSVDCTTGCGSTGTSTCTSTCELSTACIAPAESCDAVDQDCDGVVDEGLQEFAPALDHATTTRGVVTLTTADGFVVLYASTAIFAQRVDFTGALVGTPQMLAPSTGRFAAAIQGSRLIVTWIDVANIRARVVDASSFAEVTASTVVGSAGDFATGIRVVASSTSATFVFYDGSALRAFSRNFPGLTALGSQFTIASPSEQEFDVAILGGRMYVAYTTSADNIEIFNFAIGAMSATGGLLTTVTSTAAVERMPAIFATSVGGNRVGVAYAVVGTSTTSEVRFVIYDADVTGTITTARDSVTPFPSTALPSSVLASAGVDVTWGGGRWVVTAPKATSGSGSTWRYAVITERDTGAPDVDASDVVDPTTPVANASVAVSPGLGGTLLFTHGVALALARSYFFGCVD